tara:strand:+ start:11 stop:853 length:843 start_codon:yes stop_codon:yes gene_type:complete
MLKTLLLFLTLFITNIVNADENTEYKSVVVIGHIYPLYDNLPDKVTKLKHLNVLFDKVSKIDNIEKIVLLGDTYSEDLDSIYSFVNTEIIPKFKAPIIKVLGNHEVSNIARFSEEGGVSKGFFDLKDYRFLIYSPWRFIDGKPIKKILADDINFFEDNLNPINNIVLITDALYPFNADLPLWKSDIEPLLNNSHVIIGDNDFFLHQYSWVERKNIKYINQGVSDRSTRNRGSFIEVRLFDSGEVEFLVHFLKFDEDFSYVNRKIDFLDLENGLSVYYEIK